MWVLTLWAVLGILLAVSLGRVIRVADRRDPDDRSAGDDEAPPEQRWAR